MRVLTHRGYSAGHPWYYFLGGDIPPIRAIRADVLAGAYRGYLADHIAGLSTKSEPKRSADIRKLRETIVSDLRADMSRYRQCACALRARRQSQGDAAENICDERHTAISLKFNHIVNGFANLRTLDALPLQADLFGAF